MIGLSNVRQWPRRIIGWIGRKVMDPILGTQNSGGKPQWPPQEHVDRLVTYAVNTDLYLGEHEKVFVESGNWKYEYDKGREYLIVNMLGALTDLLVNRLLGTGVQVTAPDDMEGVNEFFSYLEYTNSLAAVHVEQALGLSYRGDSVYKVRYDGERRRIIVEAVSPSLWFPEMHPLDTTRIIAASVTQVMVSGGGESYLWVERNELRGEGDDTRGWITNRLFKLEGDLARGVFFDPETDEVALSTLPELEGLPEEQDTGITRLLTVHIPNRTTAETGIWGIPDYQDLPGIQAEINHRLTQRAEIHDKHADPIIWGPDIEGEDGAADLKENKYMIVPDTAHGTGPPAGVIAWDAQLASVEAALEEARRDFASVAGIDLAALRPEEGGGGAASGRALRLQQTRTQDKVRQKAGALGPGIQEVYSIAVELALAEGVDLEFEAEAELEPVRPDQVRTEFGDGLPTITMELVEEQTAMLGMRVQSRKDAIRVIHNLTDEEAGELMETIQAEGDTIAPPVSPPEAATGPRLTFTAPPGTPEEETPEGEAPAFPPGERT